MKSPENYNDSSEEREKLLLEIMRIRRRVDTYLGIWIKKIKRKRYSYIIAFSLLLIISLLSFADIIIIDNFWKIRGNEIFLACFSVYMIGISLWVLFQKSKQKSPPDYRSKSNEELNEEIKSLKEMENSYLKLAASETAHIYTALTLMSMLGLIYTIQSYSKLTIIEGFKNPVQYKNEMLLGFVSIFFISFLIGELIGSPMSPRRFRMQRLKLKNQIINAYLNNIDASSLNPRL